MNYDQIFKPETLSKLNRQSADNLRTVKQEMNLMDQEAYLSLLQDIMTIEEPYKQQLEQLAVNMVEDLYPVIEEQGIKIDAGLTDMNGTRGELDETISPEGRRRVINSITQGAALKGAFAFYLFKDHLDAIDPTLVDKYNEVMKRTFGVFDDDNVIAMMMALLAQGVDLKGSAGGSSKVIINEIKVNGKEINEIKVKKPIEIKLPMDIRNPETYDKIAPQLEKMGYTWGHNYNYLKPTQVNPWRQRRFDPLDNNTTLGLTGLRLINSVNEKKPGKFN